MSLTFPGRAACLVLGMCVPSAATAQLPGASGPKQATAVRVQRNTVRVDGRLDEPAWQQATPIRDLVQKEPVEGAEPGEPTEVRFLYDDDALYVGARMHGGGGRSAIQAPMSRRDEVDQADYIRISLDTYLDRRTAYSFGVTASGVRLDHYHPSDSETNIDEGFEPVWEARVFIDQEGWSAEMWIPLSQLRFNDLPDQVWGLNVHRWVPSRNEDDYWVAVPRTAQGWASHCGELRGIRGLEPPRRIELLPYVAAGSTVTGYRDPSNPFDDGSNLEGRVGGDLKMGLGPNLTLEATVNPDFGQVEADPAVVNLTAFETFFSERRPFFSEGSQMIGGNVRNYFYSRRIGAPPAGPASGDHIDYPRSTTILGAAKLTGRSPSGTSIGILGAVTDEEHARTFDVGSGVFHRVRVAPRTAWGVGRVQREFGVAGSTASLMLAGVHRNLATGDALASLMVRNAMTVAGESLIRLLGGDYEILVNAGLSHVQGDAPAILRVQRASQQYFHRPDAPHVEVDPTRTGMTGSKAQLRVEKTSGRHWLWNVFFELESPEVEFNDIGRLSSGDGLETSQELTFRETEPGGTFRAYRLSVGHQSEWNFARDRQLTRLTGDADLTWNNFWTTSTYVRSVVPLCCAGSGVPGARCTWSGSRTVPRKRWEDPGPASATCSAQSRAPATTSSQSRRASGCPGRVVLIALLRPMKRSTAVVLGIGMLSWIPADVVAQTCGEAGGDPVVVGIVRDPVENIPLVGARITARWLRGEGEEDGRAGARADADGRFGLCGIPASAMVTVVARAGSDRGPEVEVHVPFPGGAPVEVRLDAPVAVDTVHLAAGRPLQMTIPVATEPIPVEGIEVTVRSSAWITRRAELFNRMSQGVGHFITRREIEGRGQPPISSLLRSVPGIGIERVVVAGRSG